jgi:hypothetical protein
MLETDLVPDFRSVLESMDKAWARKIKREYAKVFRMLDGIRVRNYSAEDFDEDIRTLCWESLFDALNFFTPEYCYFGSHMGDGSDYGVWICNESLETAIHDHEISVISDLSDLDSLLHDNSRIPQTALLQNDHGNMTLYHITASFKDCITDWQLVIQYDEIWSVV